jgi:hypothetical protein
MGQRLDQQSVALARRTRRLIDDAVDDGRLSHMVGPCDLWWLVICDSAALGRSSLRWTMINQASRRFTMRHAL